MPRKFIQMLTLSYNAIINAGLGCAKAYNQGYATGNFNLPALKCHQVWYYLPKVSMIE